MRISTRMALGSTMLKPIAGYHILPDINSGGTHYGCAWGMVDVAAPDLWAETLIKAKVQLVDLPCDCEGLIVVGGLRMEPTDRRESLAIAVVHLFNFHVMMRKNWTMERLIDWVRSVEPADPEEDALEITVSDPASADSCEAVKV